MRSVSWRKEKSIVSTLTERAAPPPSERAADLPKRSESSSGASSGGAADSADQVRALQREVMNLKITNRAKDYFIEQLQKMRWVTEGNRTPPPPGCWS
jgi:hypothetical protein